MRIVALVLSLIVLLATYASAETLIYANTLPQGKWGVEAVYLQDSNVANTSGMTLTNYGVKVAYGVTNQLELDLAYGTGSYSGLPAGLTSSMTPTTAVLRYNILAESTAPATVTVAAGYKSIPVTTNYAGNSTYGKSGVGVIASKMMIPFIPYAALSYNTLDLPGPNRDRFWWNIPTRRWLITPGWGILPAPRSALA